MSLRDNVFSESLFRYYSIENIRREFANFIQQVFSQYEDFFEIIDVKYLISNYFCAHNNIKDIKHRCVRKQFVYEHLLQKALERKYPQFGNSSIYSSFWLPSYRPYDSNLLENGSTFIDGYIQLKNVNFILLAKSYFT